MGTHKDPTEIDPFKQDFKRFLYVVWSFLNLPEPTPVQYDMADYLQYGPRRKVIMAFRGVGKSWITAAFVLWLLYCNPQKKILVVSASKQRADDFSTFCLRLLNDHPLLKHLGPTDDQRQSKIAFDVRPAQADHSPSVKSAGITGQITGTRADHIVADDIEIPNNSDTQTARDKLAESVKEFDAILKPDGVITYLGTPQCEMSLYNELPARGYACRIWPARIPSDVGKYGSKLAPFIVEKVEKGVKDKTPVDPDRFDDRDLLERELSYGRTGFALQFQLDTSLSDADKYPLRLKDLTVMDLDPAKGPAELIWCNDQERVMEIPTVGLEGDKFYGPMVRPQEFAEYTGSVMFIDPSGRGKDETAWAIVKMLHGRLFLTDAGGKRGGYEDKFLKELLLKAKAHHVNRILVEPNFGDGMFAKLLGAHRPDVYMVTIEDAPWAKVQKEMRIIDTLEPVMNQHRLIIDRQLIERDYESTKSYPAEAQNSYRLFYQMTRLTREKGALRHDDRLDAVAGAVAYWLEHMGRNERQAHRDFKARTLDAELRRHIEHSVGRKLEPQNPTLRGLKALKHSSIKRRTTSKL